MNKKHMAFSKKNPVLNDTEHIPMRDFAIVSGRSETTVRVTVKELVQGIYKKQNITELMKHIHKTGEKNEED